ncbi:hypothetical protein EVA_21122 [gut metagenome]|uniref:Uncharacterized protein n=1 Tax=gut metagenome TaxID=749906 RepID=J9BT84_9ZZZZ
MIQCHCYKCNDFESKCCHSLLQCNIQPTIAIRTSCSLCNNFEYCCFPES